MKWEKLRERRDSSRCGEKELVDEGEGEGKEQRQWKIKKMWDERKSENFLVLNKNKNLKRIRKLS